VVDEPDGVAGSEGAAQTGAVREGAAHEPRVSAGSPALGLGVQALRGKPHPASDLESLDMHAGMDEPELLMQLLATIAREKLSGRVEWRIVYEYANGCVEALEKANETPRR
jgi:hypothetical protein